MKLEVQEALASFLVLKERVAGLGPLVEDINFTPHSFDLPSGKASR